MVAQLRCRFSQLAMIRLPRTFETAVGLLCKSIHWAQKPANSSNASLIQSEIRKDFAVDEYSPKYLRDASVR
jgi:hypothetical protein